MLYESLFAIQTRANFYDTGLMRQALVQCYRATRDDSLIVVAGKRLAGKAAMSLKAFLLTLGIFCGGYVSNTLLDNAVEAAEKYFRLRASDSYKTDSNGYVICSTEKPKITNADLRPLTLNALGE
jgi:hypothetical protein